jgi:hypothetical protein
MFWTRYHRGVSLSTLVRVTAYSSTGHHRRPLVRCWLAPQEQQFPVGVKKNLSYHLITKNSNGLFFYPQLNFLFWGLIFCNTTACWSTRRQTAWCPRQAPRGRSREHHAAATSAPGNKRRETHSRCSQCRSGHHRSSQRRSSHRRSSYRRSSQRRSSQRRSS